MRKVSNSSELAQAMEDGVPRFEVEANFAKGVIKLRAVGKVAYMAALGAIAITAGATYMTVKGRETSGTGSRVLAVGLIPAPVAIGILGVNGATMAVGLAVAAGSVKALSTLRSYREISRENGTLVLEKP